MPNDETEDAPPAPPVASPAPSPWPLKKTPTPEPRCIAPLYQPHGAPEPPFTRRLALARVGVVVGSALVAGVASPERSGAVAWLVGVATVAIVGPWFRSFYGPPPEPESDDEDLYFPKQASMKTRVDHEGVVPYEHKVGGHQSDDGLDVCVLVGDEIELLKRMQPLPYKLSELQFYSQDVPKHRDGVLQGILEYLPEYYGTLDVGAMRYLRLENLMRGYKKPCILDVKIGKRCYDRDAPEDKKARMKRKYPLQEQVGFRAAGLKVWKPAKSQYFELIRHSKKRTLEEFWGGRDMELFMGEQDHETKLHILEIYMHHLAKIQEWFEEQTYFEFCAMSLLFAYEGDPHVQGDDRLEPFVWLVDFAHVITDSGTTDENFLFGIRNFRKSMENNVQKVQQETA